MPLKRRGGSKVAQYWWQILGVSPDADKRAIKRAYSQLIKTHRPDESPELFARIRAAYEIANAHINHASSPTPTSDEEAWKSFEQEPLSGEKAGSETADHDLQAKGGVDQFNSELTLSHPDPIDLSAALSEIIDLLTQWKHSGYRKKAFLDHIEAHPALMELSNINALRLPVLIWLNKHVSFVRGLFEPRLSMPYADLARLDRLFGWCQMERQYFNVPDQDFTLIFFGIHRGHGGARHWNPKLGRMSRDLPVVRPVFRFGISIILILLLMLTVIIMNDRSYAGVLVLITVLTSIFTFAAFIADYGRINYMKKYPMLKPILRALDWSYFALRHVVYPITAVATVGALVLLGVVFVLKEVVGEVSGLNAESTELLVFIIMAALFSAFVLRTFFHLMLNEFDDFQVAFWQVRKNYK